MKQGNVKVETTIQQTNTSEVMAEDAKEPREPQAPIPSDTTPQEFYAEITKRADVRAILEELATK